MKALIKKLSQLSNDLSEAWITFLLKYIIPNSWQKSFTNSGLFRIVSDIGAIVLCLGIGITRPSLLYELYQIRKVTQHFQYDQKSSFHRLEIIDMSQLPSENEGNLTSKDVLDISHHRPQPILIFVHGGAFGSGQLWQYCLPAKRLGEYLNASHVVLLGYPVYPLSNIVEQKDAVISALKYLENESILKSYIHNSLQSSYFKNHQRSPIILSGHSSGAHITAFAIIDHLLKENHALNVDLYIGLAGLYDIRDHYVFESNRGVQHLSPMGLAAGDDPKDFHLSSPQYYIDKHQQELVLLQKESKKKPISFPFFTFIHGADDIVVPNSATAKFADSLQSSGLPVKYHLPVDYDHISPLLHLVDGGNDQINATKQFLQEMLNDYFEFFHYKISEKV